MSLKLVTSLRTLGMYAKAEADARKSGDKGSLEKAKAEHEAYRRLCLKSDEIMVSSDIGL